MLLRMRDYEILASLICKADCLIVCDCLTESSMSCVLQWNPSNVNSNGTEESSFIHMYVQ